MDFANELVRLSKELDFIIFEDRKFADIGESSREARLQTEHNHYVPSTPTVTSFSSF
jgi:orotidine-5'-phosphate decarboxylase